MIGANEITWTGREVLKRWILGFNRSLSRNWFDGAASCIQHLLRGNIMRVTGHIESEVITSLKCEDYTTTPAGTKKGLL